MLCLCLLGLVQRLDLCLVLRQPPRTFLTRKRRPKVERAPAALINSNEHHQQSAIVERIRGIVMNASGRLVLRTNMEDKNPEVGPIERTVAHSNSNVNTLPRRYTIRVRCWKSNGQIQFVRHIAWYEPINSNILSFILKRQTWLREMSSAPPPLPRAGSLGTDDRGLNCS